MFGVPIDGSTDIFCDNGEVCVNTTRPKLTLYKKHHIIPYHRAREAVATRTVRVPKDHTSTNLAELLTKTMAAPKREGLLEKIIYCEANWSMWVLYPSEVLPEAIGLLVSEITKLECWSAQL